LKSWRLSSQDGPQISTKSIYSHYESVVSDVEEDDSSPSHIPSHGSLSVAPRESQVGQQESFQTFQTQPEFSALDSFMDDILGLGGPSASKPAPPPSTSTAEYVFISDPGQAVRPHEAPPTRPIVAQPQSTRKTWRIDSTDPSSIPGSPIPSSIDTRQEKGQNQGTVPDNGSEKKPERPKRTDWRIKDDHVLNGSDNDKEEEQESIVQVKKKKGGLATKAKKAKMGEGQNIDPEEMQATKSGKTISKDLQTLDPSSIAIAVRITSLVKKTGRSNDDNDCRENGSGAQGVENFKRFVKNGTVGVNTLVSSGLERTTFQKRLVSVVPAPLI
jgi:hypothetical protein